MAPSCLTHPIDSRRDRGEPGGHCGEPGVHVRAGEVRPQAPAFKTGHAVWIFRPACHPGQCPYDRSRPEIDAGPPVFLAEVPFRLYMVASWLSLIPMTVGAVILGHGLLNGNFRLALSGLGVLVVFVAVVHWLRNRYAARSK